MQVVAFLVFEVLNTYLLNKVLQYCKSYTQLPAGRGTEKTFPGQNLPE